MTDDFLKYQAQTSPYPLGMEVSHPIGSYIYDTNNKKYLENKFLLFDPKGNTVINYWKANPVPGFEANSSTVKDYKIQKIVS